MKEVAETVMPQPNLTPLPMAVPPVRYFPLHKQPNSPYYSNGAFRLDFNSDHSCPNSNPNPILLENLNISTPYKSFTSLLTGAGDQDSLPPSLREQNSKIDQIINFQVIILLVLLCILVPTKVFSFLPTCCHATLKCYIIYILVHNLYFPTYKQKEAGIDFFMLVWQVNSHILIFMCTVIY